MLTTQVLLVGIYGPGRSALDAARQLVSGPSAASVFVSARLTGFWRFEAPGLRCCLGTHSLAPTCATVRRSHCERISPGPPDTTAA